MKVLLETSCVKVVDVFEDGDRVCRLIKQTTSECSNRVLSPVAWLEVHCEDAELGGGEGVVNASRVKFYVIEVISASLHLGRLN